VTSGRHYDRSRPGATFSSRAHHRDPFDRLLVAQARIEKLAVLTADRQLAAYDVEIVEA
jgi:PIN domain nuclease of toxin-antitoxin system